MSKTKTSGKFVWHEIHARDVEVAKGFYGELFGWTSRAVEMGPGTYTMFAAGGVDVGGAVKLDQGAPHWLSYCSTPDVDAATARAKARGATVIAPPTDYPTVGRFSIISHQHGGVIAPFCGEKEQPESKEAPALGTFCWNELVTQDQAAALALHKDVFGWTQEDKDMGPMGTYNILKRGDIQAGGVMKAMDPRAPSMWLGYVLVESVDKSFERAKKLGGKALVPPGDIPQIGRFAVVTDPEGAPIALFTGA